MATNYQLYPVTVDDVVGAIQIWGTAGQETFRSLAPIQYRDSVSAVFIYDVTHCRTFDSLTDWVPTCTETVKSGAVIAVAGNKCDLSDDVTQISFKDRQGWASKERYEQQLASAKSDEGIRVIFEQLARTLAIQAKSEITNDSHELTAYTEKSCLF